MTLDMVVCFNRMLLVLFDLNGVLKYGILPDTLRVLLLLQLIEFVF